MNSRTTEVRISDTVTLLPRPPGELVDVYLVAVCGRLALVACVSQRIADAGTQCETKE